MGQPPRQDVVVDWMVIDDEASAAAFAGRLLSRPRQAIGVNAIGAALLKGLELIEGNGFEGWRKVIDLSGDSAWNPRRPTIAEARDAALGAGVVINGLAILCARLLGPAAAPATSRQEFTRQADRRPRRLRGHRRRPRRLRPGGAAQADPRDRRTAPDGARRGRALAKSSPVQQCARFDVMRIDQAYCASAIHLLGEFA